MRSRWKTQSILMWEYFNIPSLNTQCLFAQIRNFQYLTPIFHTLIRVISHSKLWFDWRLSLWLNKTELHLENKIIILYIAVLHECMWRGEDQLLRVSRMYSAYNSRNLYLIDVMYFRKIYSLPRAQISLNT